VSGSSCEWSRGQAKECPCGGLGLAWGPRAAVCSVLLLPPDAGGQLARVALLAELQWRCRRQFGAPVGCLLSARLKWRKTHAPGTQPASQRLHAERTVHSAQSIHQIRRPLCCPKGQPRRARRASSADDDELLGPAWRWRAWCCRAATPSWQEWRDRWP